MVRTQIYLTEQEHRQLHMLSKRRGTTLSQLIRASIDQMLSRSTNKDRLEIMRQARGIWKDREDLPNFGELRGEFDRRAS